MASTPKDPYAKPVLIAGVVVLGAAVFVLVSNLFSTIDKNSTKGVADNTMFAAAADVNIRPIGTVNAVDKSIAPVARTGEQLYNAVCTTCHAAGVLNAPKLEKEAWAPRITKGLQGLLDSAINGINQMPARGGDPTITDQELTDAILYMTKQSGYDLSADAGASTDAAAPAADATQAVADAATVTPAAAQTAATPASATTEAPAAKPTETATLPATTVTEPAASTDAMATTATQATSTDNAAQAAPVASNTTETTVAAQVNVIDGEKVYRSICFSCHDVGIAGSPKIGDKEAWTPRIATGIDTLYNHSINGFNAMPVRGGNPALSDDEIKAAVDWMVSKSQ